MFKGKISIIKNVNGKEERVEKEFNSPEEYERFLRENAIYEEPKLSLSEWSGLGRYIESLFDRKFEDFFALEAPERELVDLPVDIDKYEREAAKIEEEKEEKENKKASIKRAIEKLKNFVKTFEKEGKKDLAKQAKEDIKKLEKELEALK